MFGILTKHPMEKRNLKLCWRCLSTSLNFEGAVAIWGRKTRTGKLQTWWQDMVADEAVTWALT